MINDTVVLVIWILSIFVGAVLLIVGSPLFGIILIIIGAGGLYLWHLGGIKQKEQEQFYANQRKAQEKKNQEIAGGKWDFPSKDFYSQCRAAGITTLETSYSQAKAKAIADAILKKNDIPEHYYPLYDSKEKLSKYLTAGLIAAAKESEEQERAKRVPQKAQITPEQEKLISFYLELAEREGKEKRNAMLDSIIASYSERIESVKEAQESMQKMAVMMASSAAQKKTTSWATAAGIANGIAGPVAGTLAGAEAIQRNAEIEAQNRRNRENVNKAAAGIMNGSFSLSGDISSLTKEREVFEQAKRDLEIKVVLEDIPARELFDSLSISNVKVAKEKNEALTISAAIKSSYVPKEIPSQVKMCIDGTLNGRVFAGNLFVGTVCLPLPLFGVECGNTNATRAETLSENYAINDNPYRIVWEPNKLWLMEV